MPGCVPGDDYFDSLSDDIKEAAESKIEYIMKIKESEAKTKFE